MKEFYVTVRFANNGSYTMRRKAESQEQAEQNEIKSIVPPRNAQARKAWAITGCRAIEIGGKNHELAS